MKNVFDKRMLIWFFGLIGLALELVLVAINLDSLNVITFMLGIGLIPAIILFVASLIFGSFSDRTKLTKYVMSIMVALVFSAILITFCQIMLRPEIVERIIENSVSTGTTQVSMSTATAGDNIQSVLLYIAFSGLGCFIGTSIYKKRMHKNSTNNEKNNEYD